MTPVSHAALTRSPVTTYVKFMLGSYEFASRNRREVDVVSALGHAVAVSDSQRDPGVEYDGAVAIHHRRKRMHQQVWIRRALISFDCLVRVPAHLRSFGAECLSCHDLLALTIGWLAAVGVRRRRRPHLVYDSHEYELGRNTGKPRSKLKLALIKRWEAFLISRCAFVISVNDSIADKLQEVHDLKQRPLVVRSTPNAWVLDPAAVRAQRLQFCQSLGLPPETFLAMYHGGIVRNRGIENFLTSLVSVPNAAAVILGNGLPGYLSELDSLARELGIHHRVLFHPAVPIVALGQYVAAADVGVMLIRAVTENNYLSLPNKLFENIQALTPVIGSAYPELSRVISGYHIGLTVDPEDLRAITVALNQIRLDTRLRHEFHENLLRAKLEMCWEREQQVLSDAYAQILGTEAPTNA